jgi:hypothetical protein
MMRRKLNAKMRFRTETRMRQRIRLNQAIAVASCMLVIAFATTIFLNLGNSEKAYAFGSGSAIANGNWNVASTWSFSGANRVPTCGDTVIIPAGKTVTVNSQENLYGCGSPLYIFVYGTLQFTNGNKIDLPCNSYVFIITGGVVKKSTAGGGNSTLISICSTTLWTAGDGELPGPDTLFAMGGSGVTLPVKLKYFNSSVVNGKVNFEWSTATELNNNFFTLERSRDGEQFEPVLTKEGAGNSTTDLYYNASDESPLQGFSYYRLKQTDYDGQYTYSDIETVKNGNGGFDAPASMEIKTVLPNPFSESFKVSFLTGKSAPVNFTLMNAAGQIVAQEKIAGEAGMNTFEFINRENLQDGIYYVSLSTENLRLTKKIIKA